ncbi:hypothetical protein [Octadecabacter ascidiaceicola]|uniref:Uncharacterized protein n=1 Tax=Octadecabacter ascidiaceicola TaxID=1655543 RepID=A0A238JQS2_9RHOB|nr:hypothetical protein [Octadecabacter ascidiaceicola]SMX32202.1 hypothetical protein OCA8868_00665 [Octadecabacter ascidiaceicola]
MKRRYWMIGFAALVGVGACSSGLWQVPAIALMNLTERTEFTVQGDTLLMNGEINSKTLDQFEAVIAANPNVTTLREGIVPGSLDDDTMIALAYRVRELGLDTELLANSEIASGGVDLFLAGVERRAERGAIVGVHSWSDGIKDAADYPREAPEHEQNRKYIEDMLGEDAFYWFTIYAASADDIYNMTDEEIIEYKLLTEPFAAAGSLE